jgi:hypothetical protein
VVAAFRAERIKLAATGSLSVKSPSVVQAETDRTSGGLQESLHLIAKILAYGWDPQAFVVLYVQKLPKHGGVLPVHSEVSSMRLFGSLVGSARSSSDP